MKTLTIGTEPLPKLRYDGPMFGGWLQFTELDRSAPSFMASFYIKEKDFSIGQLAIERAARRAKFLAALPA